MKSRDQNTKPVLYMYFAVIITLMLAAAFSVYLAYSKYTAYIFPPINKSDLAMLANLGTYFGGFLSPVFSFFSVVLIMSSIIYQQAESRKNLAKINEQINHNRDESLRLQLTELLNDAINKQHAIFEESFKITMPVGNNNLLGLVFQTDQSYTLRNLVKTLEEMDSRGDFDSCERGYQDVINEEFSRYDPTQPETYFGQVWIKLLDVQSSMTDIHQLALDLISVVHLKTIEKIFVSRYVAALNLSRECGALSSEKYDAYLCEIQDFRNSKSK